MKIATLAFKAISVVLLVISMNSALQAQDPAPPPPPPAAPRQPDSIADPPKIVRKSGDVIQGSATHRVTPTYPPLAKAAQVAGTVVVEVTVDEEGNVMSARAVSGHPLLKDASVAAARGWKFTPTTLSGAPVKVIGTITFNFTPPSGEDIERAKEEIRANPNSVEAHLKLGQAYRDMNYNREAAAAFETAISLDPQSAKAHRALAEAYTRSGRREDSVKHLREAIRLEPDSVESYLILGRVHQGLEQDQEAIDVYKQALSRNPREGDSQFIYTAIGLSNFKMGRYQEAIDAFNQAVAINRLSAAKDFGLGAYMGLCMTYIKLGDKTSALAVYESVKGINPSLADQLLEQINKMP